ncbi:hypothetical protein BDA96_01G258300 [Sorghum bicolor]|uniref:EGF-like domain-containing protein n=1 Tax=Sorghum bicolor TaxID=4558 RepID=A0A921S185_SORBI|nr:hypothetical protein BDA96_01G258300 [Sorghum bicolor]
MRELARGSAAAAPSEAARRRLLLLPLVVALLGGAGYTVGASVCDTANCGKGNCSETPLPPNFECHCDPGCACLNLNLSQPPLPPKDVCSVVSCGPGGKCKAVGDPLSFSYRCDCRPGYANLLNLTTLPCVNCFLGDECHALGLGPPPPAPAPSGGHGPSGPSAPPSGTKGNATDDSLGSASLGTIRSCSGFFAAIVDDSADRRSASLLPTSKVAERSSESLAPDVTVVSSHNDFAELQGGTSVPNHVQQPSMVT